MLYTLFAGSIEKFESRHGIVRSSPESIRSAMIFGEYYPNPGLGEVVAVTMPLAFLAEWFGTFLLVSLIFAQSESLGTATLHPDLIPFCVGITVSSIICVIAPITQAGLNPARDLAPRLFAWLDGWKYAAFPDDSFGFLIVYVLAPLLGGLAAAFCYERSLAGPPQSVVSRSETSPRTTESEN